MPDSSPAQLDPAIASYYNRAQEATRLEQGSSQLEFARTLELIERCTPAPPAVILDIGGGPGAYATKLAARGYTVHLIDPMPVLVEEARNRSIKETAPLASSRVGDARRVDWPSEAADIALLLGPLYHLPEAADRRLALSEAFRVLRPGGILFAAGISRFASALDGLVRDLFRDPEFGKIVERDLATGQHRNSTSRLDYFTTAYFHHPDELREEIGSAGFVVDGLYGLEGPGWLLQDFDRRWTDQRSRQELLRVARALESEPSLLGLSAHLLAVGRRPLPQRNVPGLT
jgi:ubiquinone/menaquinone biosynthesis C-methylase UbiE